MEHKPTSENPYGDLVGGPRNNSNVNSMSQLTNLNMSMSVMDYSNNLQPNKLMSFMSKDGGTGAAESP